MHDESCNLSCNLMYGMISDRVMIKRDYLGKHNSDIYPDDPNLVSAIANNRRDEKKNKYLIPAETSRSAEKKNYVQTISANLQFDSTQSFLWGNSNEIEAYSGKLFEFLIVEALESKDETISARINIVLLDYIPFAIADFYFSICEQYPNEATMLIDPKYFADAEDCKNLQLESIARLYQRVQYDFISALSDFLNQRENTLKLDKTFSIFIKEKLLPVIEAALSDNFLSAEAITTMQRNHERLIEVFNAELKLSPETVGYHENEYANRERQIVPDLAAASREYVENLARIQQEHDEPFDLTILQNRWKPEMCL
ncbi:hypothetical protein LJC32_04150 [Oscillospiraceae bacterium OttesenSCG-928-F05]|nr:hypothetical protein [Oscillospiraceae bacterium OttesenSCG-928-F05]